jgi:hypothetical protein
MSNLCKLMNVVLCCRCCVCLCVKTLPAGLVVVCEAAVVWIEIWVCWGKERKVCPIACIRLGFPLPDGFIVSNHERFTSFALCVFLQPGWDFHTLDKLCFSRTQWGGAWACWAGQHGGQFPCRGMSGGGGDGGQSPPFPLSCG